MPFRKPIAYVDIRAFAHATEDSDKVLKAMQNILPIELSETVIFRKSNVSGHHGNPIALFEARIKDKKAAGAVFGKVCQNLGIPDKESLSREIDRHLEKSKLYLRLDKQSAFLGEFKLGVEDGVHLCVHFKRHTREDVMATIRDYGLIP